MSDTEKKKVNWNQVGKITVAIATATITLVTTLSGNSNQKN